MTGSVGKTTTKDLLGEMLASAGPTTRTRKNDNNLYGVPATLLSVHPTDRFAAIEIGIFHKPGEMAWMAACSARARPFSPGSTRITCPRTGPDGRSRSKSGRSSSGWARREPRSSDIPVALYGTHLAPLVPLALGAALACGASVDGALGALARFRPPEGRLHPEAGPNGSIFLRDDYKNRPRSAIAAVRTLRDVPAQRRIVVLGEFQPDGYTDDDFEPVAAELPVAADLVIAVGRAAGPVRSLLSATQLGERVFTADGVEEAAALLGSELREGDAVLLKGATRQHFHRIKLLLEGATVGCRVRRCSLNTLCTDCPYLLTGPPARLIEAD